MRHRLLVAMFAMSLAAAAQSLSIQQLRSFLQSSVKLKQADKEVAATLAHARLTEKLDDRTIEELQSFGIGPRTRAVLRGLRDQSQGRAAAAPIAPEPQPKPAPPPSEEEQGAIIAQVRDYSLDYSKNLPDFICTQITRRYITGISGNRTGAEPSWLLKDTLTLRLSYFQQKEDYKLILVNNSLAPEDYRKLSGAVSTGEFGSMIRGVFEPQTKTRFEWAQWATVRGRPAMAFKFHVAQDRSQWELEYEGQLRTFPAYSGIVYADKVTHEVLRATFEAEGIPAGFPIHQAETRLDYDFQKIGDHPFLLPLKAENRMTTDQERTRNEVEFRSYQKFSTESEIKYDAAAEPAQPPK
jgi:hypothetical protein